MDLLVGLRGILSHLIYSSIGMPNLVRIIEWRSMMRWLELKEGEKVLDVACGGGTLSCKIAKRGCEVHGIDMSQEAIDIAKRIAEREKVTCEFKVVNAEELHNPEGYFDKVVFSSSLEHIKDDMKSLKEAYRVLKPNGIIILTVPSLTYRIDEKIKERHRKIAYVVNYYTRETLEKKLETTGFNVIRSKYLLNSYLTTFFCKIGIKLEWRGLLWFSMFPIAYICLISDRFFGMGDKGYTLIAEGKKT